MPRRGDAEDEASNWESLPRKASKQQDVQRRAFVQLPVRAHAHCAEAGEAWVAPGLHSQPWMAARVAVEGVEVLDDLAEPQGRQQIHEQDVQGQERGGVRKRKAESVLRPLERVCQVRPNLAMSPGGTQSDDVRRQAAKRQLAIAAQQLLQDPERQLPQLKALLELLHDEDGQVCRLAMLTLLAVFKDLLPAYRIRPVVDKEEGAGKLSKDVRALKLYEKTLLDSYHKYLQALKQTLKRSTAGQAPMQHGRVAIKCMAGLLLAAPHFNYRSDLLQALVTCLPHKDSQVRDAAQDGLSDLLAGSFGDGEVATEVVQLLADLVRHLECVGPPALLDCLLSLRFPDVVVPISSSDASRSKKKLKKAQDGVDRSFLEAQAAVATAERRANQTATVEALFELLFRVLKTCTASSVIQQQEGSPLSRAQFMKKFPLLFPALRLLSKNVHLLGMEYIQGVMRELRLLLCSSALPPEERLRVLLTAAELVQGEGEMLSAEHSNFYVETYAALVHSMLVPILENRSDLPLSMSSPSDQEDAVFTSMITSTNASMKAGEQMCFLVPSIVQALVLDAKALDPPRQAAFAKRMLALVAGAGDSGLAMGMLCLLQRMLRRSRRLQAMLQHEAGGSTLHAYIPDAADPAEACALAAPFWELTLLARHYHPHVAAVSEQLAAGNPVSMLPLYGAVAAFSTAYSTCTGGFRPDVGRKEA